MNLGGGFRVARMPDETGADMNALMSFASFEMKKFCSETERKLHLEIEPGAYVMANAGFLITSVIDIKKHFGNSFSFYIP